MPRSEAATADLKDIRCQIRNLQQQRRRVHSAKKIFSQRHPSGTCTLLVFHFSGHDSSMAIDFIRGRGRAKGKVSKPRRKRDRNCAWQCRSILLLVFNMGGCDPTVWVGVTQRELLISARFVLERRLYDWVWLQNCVKGAPSRNQLMEEGAKLLPLCRSLQSPLSKLCFNLARTQRKWLASFRIRWNARIGALKIQEHVPLHVMQSKAHDWGASNSPDSFCSEPFKVIFLLIILF